MRSSWEGELADRQGKQWKEESIGNHKLKKRKN